MPRKYRPPAARRRKTKRPAPHFVEPLPEDGDIAAAPVDETVSTIERLEEPPVTPVAAKATPRPSDRAASPAAAKAPARESDRTASAAARHISRDYSYVRAEVKRIVLVASFLIVSLIITALLRN